MALFKRRNRPKVISLLASDQGEASLNLIFTGAQVHLDANRMAPGVYSLKVAYGKEVSLQEFIVQEG